MTTKTASEDRPTPKRKRRTAASRTRLDRLPELPVIRWGLGGLAVPEWAEYVEDVCACCGGAVTSTGLRETCRRGWCRFPEAAQPQPLAHHVTVAVGRVLWELQGERPVPITERVRIAQEIAAQAEEMVCLLVYSARRQGESWTTIGQALGMSRQSAWQRFSGKVPEGECPADVEDEGDSV